MTKLSVPSSQCTTTDQGSPLRTGARAVWEVSGNGLSTGTCLRIERGELVAPPARVPNTRAVIIAHIVVELADYDLHERSYRNVHQSRGSTHKGVEWVPLPHLTDGHWRAQHLHWHSARTMELAMPLLAGMKPSTFSYASLVPAVVTTLPVALREGSFPTITRDCSIAQARADDRIFSIDDCLAPNTTIQELTSSGATDRVLRVGFARPHPQSTDDHLDMTPNAPPAGAQSQHDHTANGPLTDPAGRTITVRTNTAWVTDMIRRSMADVQTVPHTKALDILRLACPGIDPAAAYAAITSCGSAAEARVELGYLRMLALGETPPTCTR